MYTRPLPIVVIAIGSVIISLGTAHAYWMQACVSLTTNGKPSYDHDCAWFEVPRWTSPDGGPIHGVGGPSGPTNGAPPRAVGKNSGDPVSADGDFVHDEVDLSFPGFGIPFEFKRTYR